MDVDVGGAGCRDHDTIGGGQKRRVEDVEMCGGGSAV